MVLKYLEQRFDDRVSGALIDGMSILEDMVAGYKDRHWVRKDPYLFDRIYDGAVNGLVEAATEGTLDEIHIRRTMRQRILDQIRTVTNHGARPKNLGFYFVNAEGEEELREFEDVSSLSAEKHYQLQEAVDVLSTHLNPTELSLIMAYSSGQTMRELSGTFVFPGGATITEKNICFRIASIRAKILRKGIPEKLGIDPAPFDNTNAA